MVGRVDSSTEAPQRNVLDQEHRLAAAVVLQGHLLVLDARPSLHTSSLASLQRLLMLVVVAHLTSGSGRMTEPSPSTGCRLYGDTWSKLKCSTSSIGFLRGTNTVESGDICHMREPSYTTHSKKRQEVSSIAVQ